MKKILSIILWTAGILFFGLQALVYGFLLTFIPPFKLFPLIRTTFRIQLLLMGISCEISGQEHIDPEQPYLIMGNHESLFDIFMIPSAIPFPFTAAEAAYHFGLPIWGYLIRRWGCIPIHRRDRDRAIQDLEKVKETFEKGVSIMILPEGHRTLDGKIGEFKKGPFHIALGSKATILPFGMNGLFNYNSKGSFILNPTTVMFTFGPPIPYDDYKDDSVEELSARLREVITELKGSE